MTWVVFGVAAVVSVVVWWRRLRSMGRQHRLMLLCERAGLAFAPLDVFGDTTWLPFPIFGRDRSGSENVVWDRERGPAIRAFDFWYEEPTTQERPVAPRTRRRGRPRRLSRRPPRRRRPPRPALNLAGHRGGGIRS